MSGYNYQKKYCIHLSEDLFNLCTVCGDIDEMQHYAAFHQGLHFLQKYSLRGFSNIKGLKICCFVINVEYLYHMSKLIWLCFYHYSNSGSDRLPTEGNTNILYNILNPVITLGKKIEDISRKKAELNTYVLDKNEGTLTDDKSSSTSQKGLKVDILLYFVRLSFNNYTSWTSIFN